MGRKVRYPHRFDTFNHDCDSDNQNSEDFLQPSQGEEGHKFRCVLNLDVSRPESDFNIPGAQLKVEFPQNGVYDFQLLHTNKQVDLSEDGPHSLKCYRRS